MKITVTQKHIDFGLRGSCSRDPICLAMLEAGLDDPWVSLQYLRWSKNRRTYFHPIPESVILFMKRFDNQRPTGPFIFEVEL